LFVGIFVSSVKPKSPLKSRPEQSPDCQTHCSNHRLYRSPQQEKWLLDERLVSDFLTLVFGRLIIKGGDEFSLVFLDRESVIARFLDERGHALHIKPFCIISAICHTERGCSASLHLLITPYDKRAVTPSRDTPPVAPSSPPQSSCCSACQGRREIRLPCLRRLVLVHRFSRR